MPPWYMLSKCLQPEDWRASCSLEGWPLGIAVFFFPTKQNHTSQAKNNLSKVVTCDTKVFFFLRLFLPKVPTLLPGMAITTHTRSSELEYVSGLIKAMLHDSQDVEDLVWIKCTWSGSSFSPAHGCGRQPGSHPEAPLPCFSLATVTTSGLLFAVQQL